MSFGFPYVVRVRREAAPIGGTTADAAAAAGIPAVIAEAGGCGLLEESAVRLHLDGLAARARASRHAARASRRRGSGRAAARRPLPLAPVGERGLVGAGRARRRRRRAPERALGTVRNLFGDVLEEVVAPEDGVVLFLTSSPAVEADGLLLGLGAGLQPIG